MTEHTTRPTRDRHPARSARIIATGISVSGLVSLVTAFNAQALRQTASAETPSGTTSATVAPVLAPLIEASSAQAPSIPKPARATAPAPSAAPAATGVAPADTNVAANVQPEPSRVVLEAPVIAPAQPAPSAVSSGSN